MPEPPPLEVPHILQSDCGDSAPELCGPTCVQMVLKLIGTNLGTASNGAIQRSLYEITRDPGPAWYSHPEGLVRALTRHRPAARRSSFNFQRFEEPRDRSRLRNQIEVISKLLALTIRQERVAPIIAVRRNLHWIVVNGYQVRSGSTETSDFSRFELRNLIIRNPLGWYRDDGSGSCSLPSATSLPIAPEDCIRYDVWRDEYLSYKPSEYSRTRSSSASHSFHLVYDQNSDLQARTRAELALIRPSIIRPMMSEDSKQSAPLNPATLPTLALQAVVEENLLSMPLWFNECKKQPLAPYPPVLVKSLDAGYVDYYLVPIQNEQGRAPILLSLSAKDGSFREATVWPGGDFTNPLYRAQKLVNSLIGQQVTERKNQKMYRITKVKPHPWAQFVWKPCPESYSAFKPFYYFLAETDWGGEQTIYVPADNHHLIHLELTEPTRLGA